MAGDDRAAAMLGGPTSRWPACGPLPPDPARHDVRFVLRPGNFDRQGADGRAAEKAVFDAAASLLGDAVPCGDNENAERWRNEYLYSRAACIYGGTGEIQRNISPNGPTRSRPW